ncbi:MAG: PilZ domain-containing protein [Desulfovibrio sp.]|nr:PilZ domain-containing protein [Desulfovibrio sp.]
MTTPSPLTPENQDNKRQYLRLPRPYRVQARELVFPIAKDSLFDTETRDISKGGLCVESDTPLPVGTRLHITVHMPRLNKFSSGFFKVYENDTDQYFQVIADVSWSRAVGGKYLLGLSFINIDEDIAAAVNRLVEDAFKTLAPPSG